VKRDFGLLQFKGDSDIIVDWVPDKGIPGSALRYEKGSA